MRESLRTLVRLAAVAVLAAGASACSTMADLNPWSGNTASDSEGYPMPAPPADADTSSAAPAASSAGADSAAYPDVAAVPEKPKPVSTPAERTQIADALVADRSRAQYSTDLLRGGTEPAAPPPPAPPREDISKLSPADTTDNSDNTDNGENPDTSDTSTSDTSDNGAMSTPPPEPAPAPTPNQQTAPSTQVASATPPPASEPAVPYVRSLGTIPGAEPAIPADAPLAFKPSSAPPLDSSVSQFVPESVIARYQATQAEAAQITAPAAGKPLPAKPATKRKGAPDKQSSDDGSSVLVNLAAIGKAPGVVNASAGSPGLISAPLSASGRDPAGVVFFSATGSAINTAGMAQIRSVAAAFKARGDRGYVRVVGHSASRTGNMPLAEHIAYVFKQSQQHADAVAQALIKAGIPANAVIVEAVGDTQPVYYESMPKGEEGNRRTEIFIEG
jgi:flagellar motor protein MotB